MRTLKSYLVALLSLVLLTGCVASPVPGFQETRPTAVHVEVTPLEFNAQYIRTDGYHEDVSYPQVAVLKSESDFDGYYQANKDRYDLEAKTQTGVGTEPDLGFMNLTGRYDAAFFAERYLAVILLEEPSGSIRHQVTAVSRWEDGRIGIAVERIVPEAGTDDMAEWHILVELSRDFLAQDATEICVHLDGRLAWDGGSIVEPLGQLPQYTAPPAAMLRTPDEDVTLQPQGYHWFYKNPDGTETGAIADQISRPVPADKLKPVSLDGKFAEPVEAYVCPGGDPADGVGYLVKLHWELQPDSVTYTCWPAGPRTNVDIAEQSVEALDGNAFYAKQGGYIYEIVAHWKNNPDYRGSANYYVYLLGGVDHGHLGTDTAQTVEDPITGYCGNTQTKLHIGNRIYEFMGSHSVTLTDILVNLKYDPMKVCRCKPEYTVDTEFNTGYGINLTQGYARCEKGQADLTREQIQKIAEIIAWAETTDGIYLILD